MFVLGLVRITCAVVVFFRDLSQIIAIFLQVGVWMTPIMWNFEDLHIHGFLRMIFRLNPMYYIVEGYRGALIDGRWFWEDAGLTIYFWAVTLVLLFLGKRIFNRLRVHFADIL